MILSDFEERWRWLSKRAGGDNNLVQEKNELEHIYGLMRACDCKTYLEIGSAEGTTLHTLGSIPDHVDYIDFCEPHTEELRKEITAHNTKFNCLKGDSTKPITHPGRFFRKDDGMLIYDCVLIDGGHDFASVLSDSILYAPMAERYVFWHDIQLPEVREAVEWFVPRWDLGKFSTFVNSANYGYGILEIGR